jgi:hypothetical protein
LEKWCQSAWGPEADWHDKLLICQAFKGSFFGADLHAALPGLWPWIAQASKRLHRNLLAIALANKLARIAWAVLARGRAYQPRIVANAS